MLVALVGVKFALATLVTVDMVRVAASVAEDPNYVNVALNFASLVILVAGIFLAPRALKAKRQEAELREKDRLIEGHHRLASMKEEEADAFREKSAELGAALDEARSEASAWQARYQEQSQYTAAPALEAIRTLLEQSEKAAAHRHTEMLMVLRALRALVPGRTQFDVPAEGLSD